jgi:hypothetical protein
MHLSILAGGTDCISFFFAHAALAALSFKDLMFLR